MSLSSGLPNPFSAMYPAYLFSPTVAQPVIPGAAALPWQIPTQLPAQPQPQTQTPPGRFETREGRLYDPQGRLFQGVGVNVTPAFTPMVDGNGNPDTSKINAFLDELKAQGATAIRLNRRSDSNPNDPKAEDLNDEAFINKAWVVAEAARARGMAVTITHRRPDEYDTKGKLINGISLMTDEEARRQTEFWRKAAQAFRQNDNVLFGINNETGGGRREVDAFKATEATQATWLAQQKDTIAAIRSQKAVQPIIIPDWGGDLGTRMLRSGQELAQFDREQLAANGLNPDGDGNIVAGVSAYTQGYDQLMKDLPAIMRQGPAVVLSELGKVHDIPNSSVDLSLKQPVQAAADLGLSTYFWEKENLKKENQGAIYFNQWKEALQ